MGVIVKNEIEYGSSGGSYDYSTTPYDTSKKWIDGRNIKGVVITGSINSVNHHIDVSSLNIEKLFVKSIFIEKPNQECVLGQFSWDNSGYCKVWLSYDRTTLGIDVPSKYVGNDSALFIIAEYVEQISNGA